MTPWQPPGSILFDRRCALSAKDFAKSLTDRAKNLSSEEDDAHVSTYGVEASALVFSCYASVWTKFAHECERGLFSKNETLSHKLHASDWTAPPLMSSEQLVELSDLVKLTEREDLLLAIQFILENVCGERILKPVLQIDLETREGYIRLIR